MINIQRYDLDDPGTDMREFNDGDWCRWSDVEKLQKELDDMTAKAVAAVWLLPDDVSVPQLREFRTHAKEVLMGKDKQTIARLQDQLVSLQTHLDELRRPPRPGVNVVYGTKDRATGAVDHYALMITSVTRASNGGLDIEVQLP